ncbi:Athe_2463 domain-containing protein [Paenibacillus castaneae]|uniref:Athe_2463 domain-containing protein n=1 Tax=Paenibacillus castaneae TaxID=474957 RepID=UPI0011AFA739
MLNQSNIGSNVIVYGCPADIDKSQQDFKKGQYRYLGWDYEGNLYRNWMFESDSNLTKSVAKNWVRMPWETAIGTSRDIKQSNLSFHPNAEKWLKDMIDPYGHSKTFLESYNKLKGANWTADTLLDYAIIQQARTKFSPGVVQMWNIWQPDGSWWYEVFTIPPEDLPPPPTKPDLIITEIITDPITAAAASWVGENVSVKITSKNQGKTDTGPFTVGIVGTNIKSEVISNIPPGQIKTVTVKVTSAVSGIIKYTAMTDIGLSVAESNEDNNTKPFQIVFSKKNEPTTPIAIISHLDGDHRNMPEITIKPSVDPKLDDKLSYSPGKEAITVQEWKYKTPSGSTIQKKPTAKDFTVEGKYMVELRVTNSAKKVSEWAQLTINVAEKATPNPSATPPPSPEPTPTPKPDLDAKIQFNPPVIITGEKSNLINNSKGVSSYTWNFSDNLKRVLPNQFDYEYPSYTYNEPGNYKAELTVMDGEGGTKKDTAILQVIDPKPVAVVSGITRVIQGRALEYPHHLLNSYTPLADRGQKIDFSKSETRYKKVGDASYTNNWFTAAPSALGKYSIEGKVYDTTGRVSEWDALIMEVVPDLPPVVEVIAPDESYRSNDFMLYIDAESPDGDTLKHLLLEERYDHNGNGNFEEKAWTTLYNGKFKNTHAVNYNKVGKRQYRATVTEDYGMAGHSGIAATDILNYAPEVNFNVFGITQQPGQGEDSAPPVTTYTPESIFRSWSLKTPYSGGNADKQGWRVDGSSILTKKTVMANFNVGYPNSGNGANGRSKYGMGANIAKKPVWKLAEGQLITQIFAGNRIYSYQIMSNDRTEGSPQTFYERNAVTGTEIRRFTISDSANLTFLGMGNDEKLYFLDRTAAASSSNLVAIVVFDNKGNKVDQFSFQHGNGLNYLDLKNNMVHFEISPDGKSMYLAIMQMNSYVNFNNYTGELRFYKYALDSKQLLWEVPGVSTSMERFSDVKMTFAKNGDVYATYSRYRDNEMLIKITPQGVITQVPLNDSVQVSYVTLSDDETVAYVNQVRVPFNDTKISYPSLTAFSTSNLSAINGYSMESLESFGPAGIRDYGGLVSPVVRTDGTVVTNSRVVDGYYYSFSKFGSLLSKTTRSAISPNSEKIFTLPNGDIVYPIVEAIMGWGSYDVDASLILDRTQQLIGSTVRTGNTGWGTSSPILPNGNLFVFHDSQYVIPFVTPDAGGLRPVDSQTIEISDDNWGGLLYDAGSAMKNYTFEFNASVNDLTNDKLIGAGFQIQNEKNMYAMEWSQNVLSLYRVVNGAKSLLQSKPLVRNAFNTYPIKVESVNGIQRVYVNHSKLIEIADGTYSKGYAGIMSLGQPSATFSNVKKTNYGDTYTQETYETVLVNEPMYYDKLFKDIENDPMGIQEWTYSHNPNFFENPEGLSIHNGKTYGSTMNALEKPGVYEITFRAQDNPGLPAYNKWSEPVKKLLYVHRRPIAQPDVRFTGKVFAEGEALDYDTYDTSYDPDIAHILSDKMFRTRWADESTWTIGKREYYNRPGVELIVQEQVRDIHGAWSYWGQHIVYKASLPAVNQTKPVMTITAPAGTTVAAPTVLIKEPTIKWTYYDKENDPQEVYRLIFTYVDTNEIALSVEHEGAAVMYPMLEGTIVPGRIVKVQGQVSSTGVWSNLSNIRYFVLDLPPNTFLLSYNGPNGDHPIYTNSNRPQLRVFTVDPENHPITAIDYEVFRASNGVKVVDTESAMAATSYTPAPLAEGLHYWKARAFDSYIWGPYSSNGFFFVDTVKPADVNEKLEIDPNAVTVRFNAFSDTEPSSGHAARTFYMQKVNANGSVTNIDLNGDGIPEYSIPLALNARSYKVSGLIAGQEYRVTVIDHDIAGNEGYYAYIHFVTNQPPVADFNWLPKPAFEGDTVTFQSAASDPDGDTLSLMYELTSPSGTRKSYEYTLNGPVYPAAGPAVRMAETGTWSMRLTVSDGIAPPVTITKPISVQPLYVKGYVKHTELWNEHRINYNLKKTGNMDSPRGYSVFWAGERFVLEADTTVTGTAVKADRVEVSMGTYTVLLDAVNTAQTSWMGELWDAAFDQLPKGKLLFTFTAYYNNGTVKAADVEVTIDGQTLNIVGVHRVQ